MKEINQNNEIKNKEDNKPLTLQKEDFVKNLIELINNSKIPLFVIEYIIKDILYEIHSASLQQIKTDKENYNINNK